MVPCRVMVAVVDLTDDPDYTEVFRRVDPPVRVEVDLCRWVVARPDDRMAGKVPMKLRRLGVVMNDDHNPGLLHAWVRSVGGSWMGIVELELPTGDGKHVLHVTHLCPGKWIKRTG